MPDHFCSLDVVPFIMEGAGGGAGMSPPGGGGAGGAGGAGGGAGGAGGGKGMPFESTFLLTMTFPPSLSESSVKSVKSRSQITKGLSMELTIFTSHYTALLLITGNAVEMTVKNPIPWGCPEGWRIF